MPVVNGAGLVGRIVQVTPNRSTVQLITDPDFLVGVRLLGSDLATGTARGQGQGEDLLVDTRLEPEIDDPPKPGTALTTAARSSARSPTRSRSGRCAPCGRPAAGSRSSSSCGRWPTPSGCSSSPCSSGSRRRDPAQPAHGRGAHVARARHRAHAPARRGRRASRSSACRPTCCSSSPSPRHRRRSRPRAPPSGSPPGSPTTSCSRRPSACRRSPTRSSPTWSAASRTPCSAPRGGSPWRPRPRRASLGVILYGVLGTVLGEDLVGWELLRIALVVGAAQHHRSRPSWCAPMRWATGSVEQRARPGGVPVIAESPRVRMSVLGIVVFALFASLFAAPLLPAGDGHRPVPGGGPGEPDPRRARRGAARAHPRPQRQGPRRQPHLGAGHHRPHRARRARGRRAHARARPSSPRRSPGRASRRPSKTSRPTSPTSATAPTCRCPSPATCPRSSRSGSTSTPRSCPGVAAERVAVRRYPYGQLAAHVLGYTGQIIDEEFEAKAGSSKPYTLNDKIGKYGVEKIYEDDLRGTPGVALDRGRRREPADPRRRARSSRSPATTSSSTSTSTCRRRPSRRCSPGSPSPRTARAPAASRSRRPRRAPRSSSTRRPAG